MGAMPRSRAEAGAGVAGAIQIGVGASACAAAPPLRARRRTLRASPRRRKQAQPARPTAVMPIAMSPTPIARRRQSAGALTPENQRATADGRQTTRQDGDREFEREAASAWRARRVVVVVSARHERALASGSGRAWAWAAPARARAARPCCRARQHGDRPGRSARSPVAGRPRPSIGWPLHFWSAWSQSSVRSRTMVSLDVSSHSKQAVASRGRYRLCKTTSLGHRSHQRGDRPLTSARCSSRAPRCRALCRSRCAWCRRKAARRGRSGRR